MTYILHAPLGEPFRTQHRNLVNDVAARFNLRYTQRQAIEAHFTLKYHFETDSIGELEEMLRSFCAAQESFEVYIGGWNHFGRDVVYVDVLLSKEGRAMVKALTDLLRTLPWMQWSPHDAENLHPHATIAERCGWEFEDVLAYLSPRAVYSTQVVDRLTIVKQVGMDGDVTLWEEHASFPLAVPASVSA